MMWFLALDANTGGPSVTVHGWVAFIIIVGAVALAITAILALLKMLRPVVNAVEVLVDISQEFTPNGGNSLKDHINRLNHNSEVTTSALEYNQSKLEELWDYSHTFRHDVLNVLAKMAPANELLIQLLTDLHKRPLRIDDEDKG